MNPIGSNRQAVLASIAGLLVLNGLLLGSFLAQVPPHPEVDLGPLGGAGPFVGTTVAASVVAALLVHWNHRAGYGLALVVVGQNLVTFGPHKLLGPSASLTYPAVVTGSTLAAVLLVATVSELRGTRGTDDARPDSAATGEVR
jgi:hypothetical protein